MKTQSFLCVGVATFLITLTACGGSSDSRSKENQVKYDNLCERLNELADSKVPDLLSAYWMGPHAELTSLGKDFASINEDVVSKDLYKVSAMITESVTDGSGVYYEDVVAALQSTADKWCSK